MAKPTTARKKKELTRIGADQARDQFGDVIDRAWDGEWFVVTRHDREKVVVLGYREFEQLLADAAA